MYFDLTDSDIFTRFSANEDPFSEQEVEDEEEVIEFGGVSHRVCFPCNE